MILFRALLFPALFMATLITTGCARETDCEWQVKELSSEDIRDLTWRYYEVLTENPTLAAKRDFEVYDMTYEECNGDWRVNFTPKLPGDGLTAASPFVVFGDLRSKKAFAVSIYGSPKIAF